MPKKPPNGRDPDRHSPVSDSPCPASPPRAYIVSEVRLYREGLITSLSRQQGLVVVGAGTRSDALDQLGRLKPDVMLLDVASRESLGLPRLARRLVPQLHVIAFAVAEVEADVLACAEAGFCGYVAQDGSVEDLVGAVRCAISGELVCSPRIASLLFSRLGHLSTPGTITTVGGQLTPREREIAALVACGLSNKEVARRLGVSGATIKNHVHNILQKLNLQRRGEIAALRLGVALPQSALSA
jgi:two-component system, NarL family, nitrate/nitrite response regulator NarL